MSPAGKVSKVVAIEVGLALEADIHISLMMIAILDQPDKPLQDIYDVKRHEKHLTLLGSVYTLVVHYIFIYPRRVFHPECTEEIQADPFRHQAGLDHRTSTNIKYLQRIEIENVKYCNQPV